MKYIIALFILFTSIDSFAQKKMEIPESAVVSQFLKTLPEKLDGLELEDLRKSNDYLAIRIWQRHTVFTSTQDEKFTANYTYYVNNEKPIAVTHHFSESDAQELINYFLAYDVMHLENDFYRGIDGSYVIVEIATQSTYKVVSYWSPHHGKSENAATVVAMIDKINNSFDHEAFRKTFLNSLPAGNYMWGMSSLPIDRFIDDAEDKTEFYTSVAQKIKNEFKVTEQTDHWKYPGVLIDGKRAKIADLNSLTDAEVESVNFMQSDAATQALYGMFGKHGIINVRTK